MSTHPQSVETLDEHTVAYVVDTSVAFADLRQVAAQLAGLLVLSASGATSAAPDHPMIAAAGAAFDQATDAIHRAKPTARSNAHHRQLVLAAAALGSALAEAREYVRADRPSDIDAILEPVRSAYAHLRRASELLPGFELISFAQGCCGHAIDGSGRR